MQQEPSSTVLPSERSTVAKLWAGAVLLVLLLSLVCYFIVIPLLRARSYVAEFREGTSGFSPAQLVQEGPVLRDRLVGEAGGSQAMFSLMRCYMRMPAIVAPDKPTALYVLAGCGKTSEEDLARYTLSSDETVKMAALAGLAETGISDRTVIAQIAEVAQGSSSRNTRLEAIRALGASGQVTDELAECLLQAICDQSRGVRVAACSTLGTLAGKQVKPRERVCSLLLKGLEDDSQEVRDEALLGLKHCQVRSELGVSSLAAVIGNPREPEGSRRIAADLLGAAGRKAASARAELKIGMLAKSRLVRICAARAYWRVTANADETMPAVVDSLARGGPPVLLIATFLAGEMGVSSEPLILELERLQKHGDGSIRQAAREALEKIKKAQQEKQAKAKQPVETPAKPD